MSGAEGQPAAASPGGEGPSPAEIAAAAAATIVWAALSLKLLGWGARLAPMSLQKAVSWSTFRAMSQVTTTLLGVGLWFALGLAARRAGSPLARLAGRPPSGRAFAAATLAAPLVWVGAVATALAVAMPTLLEELRTRGPGASRQNAGAFAAELTGSSLLEALVAGVLLAAVSEELLFRGALFQAVDGALKRWWGPPAVAEGLGPSAGQRLRSALVDGWGAALASGLVFGLMHADMPGGVGIVRVVSTCCLGLASGAVRAATGSLWPCIALHALYNAMSLGHSRGWFSGLGPVVMGVPSAAIGAALAGLIGLVALGRASRPADAAP